MRAFLSRAAREARRFAVVLCLCFASFKISMAILPDGMGHAFQGFTGKDWIAWLFSGAELVFVAGTTVFSYATSFVFLRKVAGASLVAWAALVGAYTASFFVLGALSRLDAVLGSILPAGRPAGPASTGLAVLGFALAFGLCPMALAWLLARVRALRSWAG